MRRVPQSIIGRLAPTALIGEEQLFTVLKANFDKSGSHTSKEVRYLSLVGIAAIDSEWTEIERTWRYILQAGDLKAEYMHMVEACHLRKEFSKKKGWDDDSVFELVNALLSYVTTIPQDRYCQFICTVDMNAYRQLERETYEMPSPVDLCNTSCVEPVLDWYLHVYKGVECESQYIFDRGEPFERQFRRKWNKKRDEDMRKGKHSLWSLITSVAEADLQSTPGLQIADMLAWGRNREITKPNERYEHLALALTRLAPTIETVWDEKRLRAKYRPRIIRA